MICQISRGCCIPDCIKETIEMAAEYRHPYLLIPRKPLVVAKNFAAQRALEKKTDLILIEDDIMASGVVWDKLLATPDKVLYARAITREGEWNTVYQNGRLKFTGNCFMRIPYEYLRRLSEMEKLAPEIFAAWFFKGKYADLVPVRPDDQGRGSDIYFWYHLLQLDPPVEEIGMVLHLKTPHNRVKSCNDIPRLEAWELKNP